MSGSRTSLLVLVGLLLNAAFAVGEPADLPPRIAVVVGRSSHVTNVTNDELRDLYLRRQRLWSDGSRAIPINLPVGDPIRERFSTLVLGRGMQDLVAYWNARYFEGIMPPAVLLSPTAVRAYLAAEPGAIAYLPAAEVDETCRVLLWLQ